MNRIPSHFDEIDMIGKLADLKEEHYKNTLVLSAIIELLIERKILTTREITLKAAELDIETTLNYPIS
ncbi:MAG TPA: hypothetical protein VGE40_09925 [Bacilli bacterium]